MSQFIIQGGIPLKGLVQVGGSKNATLPILAASILASETVTLHNVPDISDVHAFLEILSSLGAELSFTPALPHQTGGTVTVNPVGLHASTIDPHLVKHMRASILLLGPLLARFKEVELAYPGGCVLGKRSVHAHVHAITAFGAELIESQDSIHFKAKELHSAKIIMAEASVTATENALMMAVLTPGTSEIRWAAMEPHVQDLCHFLVSMGAQIEGIGTHTLIVHGGCPLGGTNYTITPDYLEAGTFILAGLLTQGQITVKNCPIDHLDSFFEKLEEVGAQIRRGPKDGLPENTVEVLPSPQLHAIEKLQTSVFPGFPTDLQAPFSVLLTQCTGQSKVHETLFEGRLNYLPELERMGAKVELLNPHQAIILGPSLLKGARIVSQDIRAGAAMVLAALCAEGETEISAVDYIDRGYEKLDEKLRTLGAKIERIQE